jgi:hypothetical protein
MPTAPPLPNVVQQHPQVKRHHIAHALEKFPQATLLGIPSGAALYETLFASWAGPWKGSLVFALAYLGFWLAPMALLYRRRIFLTI